VLPDDAKKLPAQLTHTMRYVEFKPSADTKVAAVGN
jgi:hypothetical protein